MTAANSPRLSLAALLATKPGHRPRLIYRTHRARRGARRKGFTEADYAALLTLPTGSSAGRSWESGTT